MSLKKINRKSSLGKEVNSVLEASLNLKYGEECGGKV
jgi:hypothetical protein